LNDSSREESTLSNNRKGQKKNLFYNHLFCHQLTFFLTYLISYFSGVNSKLVLVCIYLSFHLAWSGVRSYYKEGLESRNYYTYKFCLNNWIWSVAQWLKLMSFLQGKCTFFKRSNPTFVQIFNVLTHCYKKINFDVFSLAYTCSAVNIIGTNIIVNLGGSLKDHSHLAKNKSNKRYHIFIRKF
jgi:hypothetical protein